CLIGPFNPCTIVDWRGAAVNIRGSGACFRRECPGGRRRTVACRPPPSGGKNRGPKQKYRRFISMLKVTLILGALAALFTTVPAALAADMGQTKTPTPAMDTAKTEKMAAPEGFVVVH